METEDIIRHYMYVANFKNQGELADYLGYTENKYCIGKSMAVFQKST